MNSQSKLPSRSWTAKEEQSGGKWFPITILSLLLISGTAFFLYFIWWSKAPQTFAVSIAVTDYDKTILPRPAYAIWNLDTFKADAGWHLLDAKLPSTREDITKSFDALRKELANEKVNQRDTVVVYLRAHAISHGGKAYVIPGDFSQQAYLANFEKTDGVLSSAVSFEELLGKLRSLKAGNVILLADICDLSAAPQLGIFANDIPVLIETVLADMKGGTPLWVITSAASLQPAHASDLRRRTLLQSACEFAFNRQNMDVGSDFFSLTKFYDSVLRYCDNVTGGKQTPLLIRNGANKALQNPDAPTWQDHWTQAKSVSLARLTKEKAKNADPSNSAKSSTPSESIPKNIENSKVADASASKDLSSENVENEDSSPWLRFWQLRDELQDRTKTGGLSPVDFAAAAWCRALNEAVKLERMARLEANGSQSPFVKDIDLLVQQFKNLRDAMASKSKATALSDFDSWNSILDQLTPNSGRRPWLFPEELPSTKQAQWQDLRDKYRIYFDAMGNLALWLEVVLNERSEQRTELAASLDELLDALIKVDKELELNKDSLLDSRIASIDGVRSAADKLKRLRRSQIDELKKKLLSPSKKQIHWKDEFAIQQLLQDPTISYADRKQLTAIRDSLKPDYLNEPGTNNDNVDTTKKLSELLEQRNPADAFAHANNCVKLYGKAFRLVLGEQSNDVQVALERLLSADLKTPGDSVSRWKQSCLSGSLLSKQEEQTVADILMVVSKDTGVHVALSTNRVQLQSNGSTRVEFTIKRNNGTPVPTCWLQWVLMDKKDFKGQREKLLRINSSNGSNLVEGNVDSLPVKPGGQVTLEFETSLNQTQLDGFEIGLRIAESESAAKLVQQQKVQILLPNPNQIDLYANCLNPGVQSKTLLSQAHDFGPVLQGLIVPAAGNDKKHAKSRYELYLWNRSDEPKTVIASLYAASPPGSSNGNGTISAKSVENTLNELPSLKPAFVTKAPLTLSKNDLLSTNPAARQRLEFSAVTENGQAPKQLGEFGLLLVVEEVVPGENNSFTPLGKNTYHWIECRPQNPFGTLVNVTPANVANWFKFKFDVPKKLWETWDLDKLPLQVTLADSNGMEVPSEGGDRIDIDSDKSEVSMQIKPQDAVTDNRMLFAHIDIGGYPRAITYASRLKGAVEETQPATQSFVGIKKHLIEFFDKDKPVPADLTVATDSIVVPARENSDDKIVGKEIAVSKIFVPFFVDCRTKTKITLSLGEKITREFDYDRQFVPSFEVAGGVLTFSAKMRDLSGEFNSVGKLNSHINLAVAVKDESSSTVSKDGAAIDLLFDRTPPQPGIIACDRYEIYADDESVEFSIAFPNEFESSLKKVYFAIDRKQGRVDQFDESDLLHLEAEPSSDGIWFNRVKVEAIAKLLQRSDTYSIVCRAIDEAGNVQDRHKPVEFRWTNENRPKSKPAAPPKSKPAPTPPKPALHNVTVDVTLKGKPLPDSGKLEVKGIPGATQAQKGGRKVYTKVPDGNYEVTASFIDQSGGKYEGAASLSLSAESSSQISIDLKTAK
jgi:hypothetical protein